MTNELKELEIGAFYVFDGFPSCVYFCVAKAIWGERSVLEYKEKRLVIVKSDFDKYTGHIVNVTENWLERCGNFHEVEFK